MNGKRTMLALLLSPFASLVLIIAMVVESLFHEAILVSIEGFLILTFFAIGSVAISYTFLLVVGLPIHFIFSQLKVTSWFVYSLVGVFVAVGYQWLRYLGDGMPIQLQTVGYGFYGMGGFSVSLAFWYFAVKSHGNQD